VFGFFFHYNANQSFWNQTTVILISLHLGSLLFKTLIIRGCVLSMILNHVDPQFPNSLLFLHISLSGLFSLRKSIISRIFFLEYKVQMNRILGNDGRLNFLCINYEWRSKQASREPCFDLHTTCFHMTRKIWLGS